MTNKAENWPQKKHYKLEEEPDVYSQEDLKKDLEKNEDLNLVSLIIEAKALEGRFDLLFNKNKLVELAKDCADSNTDARLETVYDNDIEGCEFIVDSLTLETIRQLYENTETSIEILKSKLLAVDLVGANDKEIEALRNAFLAGRSDMGSLEKHINKVMKGLRIYEEEQKRSRYEEILSLREGDGEKVAKEISLLMRNQDLRAVKKNPELLKKIFSESEAGKFSSALSQISEFVENFRSAHDKILSAKWEHDKKKTEAEFMKLPVPEEFDKIAAHIRIYSFLTNKSINESRDNLELAKGIMPQVGEFLKKKEKSEVMEAAEELQKEMRDFIKVVKNTERVTGEELLDIVKEGFDEYMKKKMRHRGENLPKPLMYHLLIGYEETKRLSKKGSIETWKQLKEAKDVFSKFKKNIQPIIDEYRRGIKESEDRREKSKLDSSREKARTKLNDYLYEIERKIKSSHSQNGEKPGGYAKTGIARRMLDKLLVRPHYKKLSYINKELNNIKRVVNSKDFFPDSFKAYKERLKELDQSARVYFSK